jgi:hypothetical protein
MNPSELPVSDPIKKRHKLNQFIEAFTYRQGKRQSRAKSDLPHVHHLEPINTQHDGGRNILISPVTGHSIDDSFQSKTTPNASTVPPLSYAATPAESIAEMYTPEFDSRFAISLDKSDHIARSSTSPGQAHSSAHIPMPDSGRKRSAPSDSDPNAPSSPRRKSIFRFNRLSRLEEGSARAIESPDSDNMTGMCYEQDPTTSHGEDLHNSIKDRSLNIAEVEDKMKVPHGFLRFIKRLTITGNSVVSALSIPGSVRISWSHRSGQIQSGTVQPVQDVGQNLALPHRSSQDRPENARGQGGLNKTIECRVNMDLFQELQVARYCEQETADQLKALIAKGADPNVQNPHGETALHIALGLGNAPACKALLDGGADIHIKTRDGKSLEDYGIDAENRTGENVQKYVAIRACRNAIYEYDPNQKARKASKSSARITDASSAHRDDHFSNEAYGGTSGTRASHTSSLEVAERSRVPHTREANHFSYVEDYKEVVPDHNSAFLNYTVGNLGLRPANNGLMQGPQRNFETPALSFPHQTTDISRRRRPSHIQNLVELYECSSHSTNSSSASQNMQSTGLDGGYNEGSSLAQLSSATQTYNEAIPQATHPRHLGLRISNILDDPRYPPIDPQQSSHAPRNDTDHVPQSSLSTRPPAQLSGYLQKLPTGQMALVCPLSNDDTWRYMDQGFDSNVYSQAVVQIIGEPATGLDQSMMTQEPHDSNNGGPSTLTTSLEPTLPRGTMTAILTSPDMEPPVQLNPSNFYSNPTHSAGPNTMSRLAARGDPSLHNDFFDLLDFMLPGVYPRV